MKLPSLCAAKRKSTIELAREAYDFAKKLGILSEESFAEFISHEGLEEIDAYEKQVQEVNPQEVAVREEQLGFKILGWAEQKKLAFGFDWRWSVEHHLLPNLKSIIPDLPVELVSEDYDESRKTLTVVLEINGEVVKKEIPFDNPYKLVADLNDVLPEKYAGKKFIQYDSGGDSHEFLILDASATNLVKDSPFISVINP